MDDKEVQRELEPDKTAGQRVADTSERDFCRLATKRVADWHTKYDKAITQSKYENDFLVNGDHWPADLRKAREDKGLPCLSLNHGIVHRDVVLGEMLQNMPRGKFEGKDGFSDPQLAEVGTGLVRHIEDVSKWDKVAEECVKQALTSGYPAYCVVSTDWVPGTFRQDIYIEHLPSQHSVMLDPHCRSPFALPTQGGPKWGMILRDIQKADFTRDFPGASVPSHDELDGNEKDWWTTDTCRVADYYVAEPKTVTLLLFPNDQVIKEGSDDHKALLEAASLNGAELNIIRTRKDVEYEIRLYKITSREILPDEEGKRDGQVVPSEYIPIVPWEGKYDYLSDGTKKYRGVFSNAIDANIMLSYHATLAAERAATGRQYKATAESIGPYGDDWDNSVGKSVLHFVSTPAHPDGPIEINTTTELGQAVEMMQYGGQEVKDLTNIHQATLGMGGNETSGRAIIARQTQANSSNYEFPLHFKNAIEHLYRIIESMIPKVYDYKMAVRILGDDGKLKDTATINQPASVVDETTGNIVQTYLNDLTKARFDTVVSLGPSFATQRQEATASMQAMVQGNPTLGEILGDLLIQWQDIPGADEASKRLKFILEQKYPGMIEASKSGNGKDDEVKRQIEAAITPMNQQLQQAQGMIEQLQQVVAQAQAAIQGKDAELSQAKQEFDLTKRELKVQYDEAALKTELRAEGLAQQLQALKATGDLIKPLLSDMQETKQAVESLDRAVETAIIKQKAG